MTAEAPDANREHKNSVFTMLFDDKTVLLELSNALLGTRYGADTPVEITTLKNVLSRGRVNDLSYILDDRLIVLIEHQSTMSDVMPYRMLLYIAEINKFFFRRKATPSIDSSGAKPPNFSQRQKKKSLFFCDVDFDFD